MPLRDPAVRDFIADALAHRKFIADGEFAKELLEKRIQMKLIVRNWFYLINPVRRKLSWRNAEAFVAGQSEYE